jgi:hypothetical protein
VCDVSPKPISCPALILTCRHTRSDNTVNLAQSNPTSHAQMARLRYQLDHVQADRGTPPCLSPLAGVAAESTSAALAHRPNEVQRRASLPRSPAHCLDACWGRRLRSVSAPRLHFQ